MPFVASVRYPGTSVEPHVRDVTIHPRDPNTIYASLQVGYLVKSTDGGETWRLLDQGLDCDVHTIVIDPTNPEKVIVATGGSDSRNGKAPGRALYSSLDGGDTWSSLAMDIDKEYSVPLAMHPQQPEVVFSALAVSQPSMWRRRESGPEGLMIRTRDGGTHWEPVKIDDADSSRHYVEAIVFDDQDPNRMYAAYRSGELLTSDDGGASWSPLGVKVPPEVSGMTLVHA